MTTNSKINIDTSGQTDLFAHLAAQDRSKSPVLTEATPDVRRFNAPDPANITIGNILLEEHLKLAKQKLPLVIAQVLNNEDWTEFEQRYAAKGRPPYAPRNMLGLILYGFMQGVSSLRGLERLARLDLGCMWVTTGGIAPDHANIGRFINMHSESLTESFFESIVQTTLIMTGSGIESLAGDGTVIEAECSHYKVCTEEALRAAAEEARNAMATTGDKIEQVLLDAGYFADDILAGTVERDISLLRPEGKKPGKPKDSKKCPKGHFRYDATQDVYICPAGERLIFITSAKDSEKTKGAWQVWQSPV